MMSTPLYDALRRHQIKGMASFHTPGHKSAPDVLPVDLYSLDYTELPDTDSLFEAQGPILEAERRAARLFGVKRTIFSAGGGCTMCIQAMLRQAMPQGGKVVMGRVVHRCAVNTMALLGLTPVWVMPRQDAGEGLPGRVNPQDVEAALTANPDAGAVYLTSPDYYGVLSDIQGIARVCERRQVPLLVDNAHGAHLWYVGGGLHPIQKGAAMTACSAHKTLPVLTGGAWLNINQKRYVPGVKEAMALFGSTSPSYPAMVSMDLCLDWLEKEGPAAFAQLERRVAGVKALAASLGIRQPEGEVDPVRISLNMASVGMSGQEGADYLRQKGIEPEMADGGYVVLIATPMNGEEDFLRLEQALRALPQKAPVRIPPVLLPPPVGAVCPREAVLAPGTRVSVARSVGCVAAEAACPCPPGVPVVMPGEIITQRAADFLSSYGIFDIKVIK